MEARGLIATAIQRPVTVTVGVLLVVLFGVLSLVGLPIQLTPDISKPTLSVTTVWPGAAPTEIEAEILEKQEDALKSLPGLTRMVSEARLDQGSITLELEVGTALQDALVRTTNLLSQVPSYPTAARQPVVTTASATGPPVAVAILSAPDGRRVDRYRTWMEQLVVPRLERIPGVASVFLRGGQNQEVVIEFDADAMAARGITLAHVAQVVRGELRDVSGGDMTIGKRRYLVRTPIAPDVPQDLESAVLKVTADGTAIRLGDVSEVQLGLRKPGAAVMADGKPAMAMMFFREAGTNVLEVTQKIKEAVAELQRTRLEPEGLELRVVSDQTGYIEGALDLVEQNILVGGLLAMLVLVMFLRSVAAAAVVSIAIPVCVIATALGMALMDRTVNVVSLAGMAFAVGLVVDNAIVVLENIATWRAREPDARRAALLGARQVWGAIVASTATTAAVFLPIIGWQDEVGELLRDIAVAISIAVIVSLVVSVLVIPSFAARLLSRPVAASRGPSRLVRFGERFRTGVGRQVQWVVARPRRSLAVAALAVGGSVGLAVALLPPMEYLPTGNRNLVFSMLLPPPGYSVEEMEAIGKKVQGRFVEHTRVDKDGVPALSRSFYIGDPSNGFMGAEAADGKRVGQLLQWIRGVIGEVPGLIGVATQASLFGRSVGGGRAIELEIAGPDVPTMVSVGGKIMGAVREELPGSQIRPIPSLDLGAPELRLVPRREQAARMGMSSADVGLAIDALVDGAIIGELGREGEPKLDVVLRARGGGVKSPAELASSPVATPRGEVVALGTLADLREEIGPSIIRRIERRRAITLQVSPPENIALEQAVQRVRDDVIAPMRASGTLPASVAIDLSGSAGDLARAKEKFAGVLLLAVVISFLLLAALYEDFLAPVAVMVSVPMAAAGGVLLLRVVDATLGPLAFDMMTALGFVILVGTVVNNAILVVDGSLEHLRAGASLREATASAVQGRVRPIFMTTLTTTCGLSPLVLLPGAGSELYRGIGAVVLGGLLLGTVLTIYVVPATFSLLWALRARVSGGTRQRNEDPTKVQRAPAA